MNQRVVVTGIGVVSPNGVGVDSFTKGLKEGKSGIRFLKVLEELQFSCQIAGQPDLSEHLISSYFNELELKSLQGSGLLYGAIAAKEAWSYAGLDKNIDTDWGSGCIFGSGHSAIDVIRDGIYKVDASQVKRIGSTLVQQTMESSISAFLAGYFGLGNRVSSNSSACSTGTESIILGADLIKSGQAKRMLVGSCNSSGPYIWAGFDSMRVTTRKFNHDPEKGSRPLSASASGFVPGSGAAALVLESYETARLRGAKILAEIKGYSINSGGQRNGGSMTAPNHQGIKRCIQNALQSAAIQSNQIDLISGHLTATMGDFGEVSAWAQALGLSKNQFPYIHSLKSMIGHCLAAAGSIESVAAIIQLQEQFIHPSVNCEDLDDRISDLIGKDSIPQKRIDRELNCIAKASFGFGDVNSCIIFEKFKE